MPTASDVPGLLRMMLRPEILPIILMVGFLAIFAVQSLRAGRTPSSEDSES